MSALARYFKAKGYKVAGYDRTLSALTQKMQAEEEIRINYIDEEEEIPAEFRYILRRYPGITGNGLIS